MNREDFDSSLGGTMTPSTPQRRQPEWGIILTLILGLTTWIALGWWLITY